MAEKSPWSSLKFDSLDIALAYAHMLGFTYIAANEFNDYIFAYTISPVILTEFDMQWTPMPGCKYKQIGIYTGSIFWRDTKRKI